MLYMIAYQNEKGQMVDAGIFAGEYRECLEFIEGRGMEAIIDGAVRELTIAELPE